MPQIEISSVNGWFTVKAPKQTLTLLLMAALQNHVGQENFETHASPAVQEESDCVMFVCFIPRFATAV